MYIVYVFNVGYSIVLLNLGNCIILNRISVVLIYCDNFRYIIVLVVIITLAFLNVRFLIYRY